VRSGSATSDRSRALWARVHVLEKARADEHLTAAERPFLECCLRRARARAILSDAAAVAAARPPRFRRRLLGLAATDDLPAVVRVGIAASAVAPAGAANVVARLDRHVAGHGKKSAQSRVGPSTRLT
jgi:hypothetical protein